MLGLHDKTNCWKALIHKAGAPDLRALSNCTHLFIFAVDLRGSHPLLRSIPRVLRLGVLNLTAYGVSGDQEKVGYIFHYHPSDICLKSRFDLNGSCYIDVELTRDFLIF